jgi:Zn-dependent alcohol dehydrogenase
MTEVVKAGPDAKRRSPPCRALFIHGLAAASARPASAERRISAQLEHEQWVYLCRAATPNTCSCRTSVTGELGKLDPAEAAPLACSGVTTYSAFKKFGSKIKDEPVVIMGAGGLGHMALSVLQAMGGKGAIVVDIDAEKRKAATEAGAIIAIDGAASDASQQIIQKALPASRRVARSLSLDSMAAN